MEKSSERTIYNIVDDEPSSSADVIDYLCKELNIPPIKGISYDDESLSEMAKSFYADNKKVSNGLAKSGLGWKPKFANYREGLAAMMKDEP